MPKSNRLSAVEFKILVSPLVIITTHTFKSSFLMVFVTWVIKSFAFVTHTKLCPWISVDFSQTFVATKFKG